MKIFHFLLVMFFLVSNVYSQAEKTEYIETAGSLKTTLTTEELNTVIKLTLTGNIDARDFKTIRDEMPLLEEIDLSDATIVAYEGDEGTYPWGWTVYGDNEIPQFAMHNGYQGKITLTSFVLPNTTTAIQPYAFYGCTKLLEVELPSGIQTVSSQSFIGCDLLSTITIPASLENLALDAFNRNVSYTVIEENQYYSSENGVLYNADKTTLFIAPTTLTGEFTVPATVTNIENSSFSSCTQLTSITLPEGLLRIGESAFSGCSSLTTVNIPSSVTQINSYSFSGCNGLQNIYVMPVNPLDISSNWEVFSGVDLTTCTLHVPFGSKTAYQNASQWQHFQNIVEMPGIYAQRYTLGFSPEASTKKIKLSSSVAWTASTDQAWLTVLPASGVAGSDSISISVDENPATSNRTAILTISGEGFDDKTITVTQYGTTEVTAGKLKTILGDQLATITSLTLVGTIDARDFKTMRDEMPLLEEIDLSDATIVAYEGDEGTYPWGWTVYGDNEIPQFAMYNGYQGKITLTSFVFPNNTTAIQHNAFHYCTKLLEVELPSGIQTVSSQSFIGCDLLSTITIPASVENLALDAFNRNVSYTVIEENQYYSSENRVLYNADKTTLYIAPTTLTGEFTVPATVTNIENSSFSSCTQLTSITLPEGLLRIGNSAFAGCDILTHIQLPASVDNLALDAFNRNVSYTVIEENQYYSSENGVLYNADKTTLYIAPTTLTGEFTVPATVTNIENSSFSSCTQLTSITLPEGLLRIGESAFSGCSSLTTVNIPSSVTQINSYSFYGCNGLQNIYAMPVNPLDISNYWEVFSGVDLTTCTLHVPFGSKTAYQNASQWQHFQNIVEMPGIYAQRYTLGFSPEASTKKIKLSSSVAWTASTDQSWLTVLPASGVAGSDSISISVDENPATSNRTAILTISGEGFDDKTITVTQYGTTEVTAGKLKTILGDQLATITSLTLVGTIDARDFKTMRDEMPLLEEIDLSDATIVAYEGDEGTYPWGWTVYGDNEIPLFAMHNGYQGKITLTSFVLPNTNTAIQPYAFYGCTKLLEVELPSGIQTVSSQSFIGCDLLSTITIPASVENLALDAFNRNVSYTVIEENQYYSSENRVLYNADKTTLYIAPTTLTGEFTVSATVTNIENSSFSSCTQLTSITLPEGLLRIGNSAFAGCDILTHIQLPASVDNLALDAFNRNVSYTVIEENQYYSSENGVLYNADKTILLLAPTTLTGEFTVPATVTNIENSSFSSCTQLTSITLPEGLLRIGELAFSYCSSLTTVNIPSSVTQINSYSFYGCNGLQNIYAMPVNPLDISNYWEVFSGVDLTTCTLLVPFGSKTAYQNASQWQDFQNIVEMPGILISEKNISLSAEEGSTRQIVLYSNTNWTVSNNNEAWLTVSPLSGNGNENLTFSANKNNLPNARMANVAISIGGPEMVDVQAVQLVSNALSKPLSCAGVDQVVLKNRIVTLDGTGSFDPDGYPISFYWIVPDGIQLSADNIASPSFFAPDVDAETIFPFILIVSDGITDSEPDTVRVVVCNADSAKVAYYTLNKEMNNTATQPDSDPILNMLLADPYLDVTLFLMSDVSNTAPVDNSLFDVVIVQESFFGGNEILTPLGGLGLANINKPFLYNKNFALTDGRAFANGNLGRGAETESILTITVDTLSQGNDLFKGIIFTDNKAKLFQSGAGDFGINDRQKALNYANNVVISTDNTLLAIPSDIVDTPTICFNDIPSGTVIGGETLAARMITVGMNFGAICKDNGTNITAKGLTIWRNAVYMLAGLPVPNMLVGIEQNNIPIANAGSNQEVNELSVVSLNGSASSDPDGDPVNYKWTAPVGIVLSSSTAAKPTFTAPEVQNDMQLTFSLVVNDGRLYSSADQVFITVKQVNKPPVANAGPDQTVNEGTTVSLDGSASSDPDGDAFTYLWTAPTGITLSDAEVQKPTFTAPEVKNDTLLVFLLVVNDGKLNSPADQVVVTVKNVNIVPVANAGPDQTVNEGATVSLDGSASSDPDGDAFTYLWTAPTGITLSDAEVQKPTFTAPEVKNDTLLVFSLVVNDGKLDSPADQVIITVKNVNKAPVANAGPDQTVNEGATVSLDGSASSDPDGDAFTYLWTAPTGITLSDAEVQKPTFTAPEVKNDTLLVFLLVVNDGKLDSPADQVVITVKNVNKAPVANAGPDQTVNEGATVSLDGSGSSDPDGDPVNYKWSAPAGVVLSSSTVAKPGFIAPEVKNDTLLVFSLVVNDGKLDSPADQLFVAVKNVNKPPVANAGPDQTVNEGATVSLDGSGSSDPDGDPVNYKWSAPAGVVLSSSTVAKPTFIAPEVKNDTLLVFSLVVNDGKLDSPADQVVITVKNVNKAPCGKCWPRPNRERGCHGKPRR
jgi:hypothetical protein